MHFLHEQFGKGYDLQKLYENIPKESETTKYRRKITSDMQNEEVFKAFDRYAKQVARAVSYEKKSTYSNLIYQKQKWHLDSLLIYIQAVEQLLDDLKGSRLIRMQWKNLFRIFAR